MERLNRLLKESFLKFNINLTGRKVLTEAASGNYICTPLFAAMAGAKVYAFAKETKFGTIINIKKEILFFAQKLGIDKNILVVENIDQVPLNELDVVTNTGFLRPINRFLINKLNSNCVIPLMWEPWEFRKNDLDLEAAINKGIKVYGTNESDNRLKTTNYIGLIALYFLLKEKRTPISSKILIIGCEKFCQPIDDILRKNNYKTKYIITRSLVMTDKSDFDTIIIAENLDNRLIIGENSGSIFKPELFNEDDLIIHISGNADLKKVVCKKYPKTTKPFGYMSFTTDFIDPVAVFDLHSAGLKVAEGMLIANSKKLKGADYKKFMQQEYPALAFSKKEYW